MGDAENTERLEVLKVRVETAKQDAFRAALAIGGNMPTIAGVLFDSARLKVIEVQVARLTAAFHSEHQGTEHEKTYLELVDYWEAVKRKVEK